VIELAHKIDPIIKVIHEYNYNEKSPLTYHTTFIFKYGTIKTKGGLSHLALTGPVQQPLLEHRGNNYV